jgi:hypothetical protein
MGARHRRISIDMNTINGRVGIISDVHGTVPVALRAIRQLVAADVTELHSLGDFGIPWNGSAHELQQLDEVQAELDKHGVTLFITGGNHDGYDEWDKIPAGTDGIRWVRHNIGLLPRGWRATSPTGNIIASLGGANSIDRASRKPHSSWWSQESITEADLAALGHDRVDVLLGHDVPKSSALDAELIPNESMWHPVGLAYAQHGQAMFHRGVRQVRPRLTIGGHYHLHLDSTERFVDLSGSVFETRVVVLAADGHHTTIAVLNTDTLELNYPEF